MKTLFLLALLAPTLGFAQNISNMPELAKLLIHHYDCRLAYLPANGEAKEMNFVVSPQVSGHAQSDFTLTQGADKLVASANSQMLAVVWTRGNQTVANAQAWVQNSTDSSVRIDGL